MGPIQTSASRAAETRRVSVLLPLPLGGAYDYALPPDMAPVPGSFVVVPLGPRRLTGVVWGPATGDVATEKLKYVIALVDAPPVAEELRRLIDWTARYTLNAPGSILRMAMSVPEALHPPKPAIGYAPGHGEGAVLALARIRLTDARRRVMAVLADGRARTMAALTAEAGVGAAVVRGLAEHDCLIAVALTAEDGARQPDWRRPGPRLSPAQQEAARALVAAGGEAGSSVTLLDGVTGSGKTEVYFEAVAATLAAGRQVLVMLPEIALTAQWLQRFERRFGAPPLQWHSDIPGRKRRQTWRAVAGGDGRIVVGARSALFLPFRDLGLIVVDEEHDTSFKQEDGAIYNARDMAVVRAAMGRFPVVLVSATPSLETMVNCWRGRYRRLVLPERHAGASLPTITAIDLRAEEMGRQRWISPRLHAALAETLEAGEQAMLFLNRRGYAPLTLCRACGHRLACPNCTAWLVEHRLAGRLQCHHCGHATPLPGDCPECGAHEPFAACGPGVERLNEETARAFPAARLAIMASDTLQRPQAAAELVRRIEAREIDILIGTQIVAKGHHFPMLTLVGVIDADLGLAGGDLRAAERTYQLLHQVAGRAGREDRPGRVLVQTFQPEHPVMEALISGQRDRFLEAEAAARRAHEMPPFGRLAAVIVSGPNEAAVDAASRALARTAPDGAGIRVLGPAPAPLAILRGRHRRRLLMKTGRTVNIQKLLKRWLRQVRLKGDVRVQVDIDPYSFL
jgi:primosomal protein N' (replication factor Y) (superfamily II helicase)